MTLSNSTLLLSLALAACDVHSVGDLVPETVDEDAAIPAVDVNETRLHLQTFGDPDRQAIVFLHSGPGDDYRAMLPLRNEVDGYRLEDDHFLVFFDQRGSGLSRRHDDPDELTLDLWVEDVRAVLDAVVPNQAVALVGHSGGGLLAAAFVDRYPDRVRGAVLLEPSPLTGALAEELATTTSVEIDVLDEWVNDWMWGQGILSPNDHASLDYALTQAVQDTQTARRSDGPVPTWRYGGACKIAMTLGEMSEYSYDFTSEHLAQAQAPILVVAGEDTEDMGATFQQRQLAFFREAQLEVIPGAGHNDLVYWQADDTLRVIVPFLRSLP